MQEVRMAVTQNTCPKAVQLGSSKDALPAHLMWWYMPVIPVLRRLRQKDTEFKANQGHIMKPCLKKKKMPSAPIKRTPASVNRGGFARVPISSDIWLSL
jgi:hypothetical protein